MRKVNKEGRNLVKKSEGLELEAYLPTPDDVWTIGFGHTKGVKKGQCINYRQAEEFLTADLEWAEKCVDELVEVPLNDNQFAALVSFTFNLGCGALLGSTLLKVLNDGDYEEASRQILRWNKQRNKATGEMVVLAGLTTRRIEEQELFLS